MAVTEVQNWGQLQSESASTAVAVCDVYTTWCGPCKAAAPVFAGLAKANPGIRFLKADLENAALRKLSSELHISSIPTFIVFKSGKVHKLVTGAKFDAVRDAVASAGEELVMTEEAEASGSMCTVM